MSARISMGKVSKEYRPMYSQKLILALIFTVSVAFGHLSPAQGGEQQDLAKSVVLIRSIEQDFDYVTPWKHKGMREGIGSGFVVEGKRILTNAHNVSNCKYIELRKENTAKRYAARVAFIGHDCDLAVLTVDDEVDRLIDRPLQG